VYKHTSIETTKETGVGRHPSSQKNAMQSRTAVDSSFFMQFFGFYINDSIYF